jgi:hypothetical protein
VRPVSLCQLTYANGHVNGPSSLALALSYANNFRAALKKLSSPASEARPGTQLAQLLTKVESWVPARASLGRDDSFLANGSAETSGKKRDRSFAYRDYLERLRAGTELDVRR